MSPVLHNIPAAGTRLHDIITWGADQFEQAGLFYGHGMQDALDEAAYLAGFALQLDVEFGAEELEQPVEAEALQNILTLYQQRIATRQPAAYLTHEAWFCGLRFYVNQDVLVPRSPIAELIMEQFAPWIDADKVHAILDMCTGSGCIAVACALAFPQATVDAADISPAALAVARRNIADYQLQDRVQLVESDLFTNFQQQRYDIIVSNPPYVDAEDMANLPEEYRHEPALGLAAGHSGLDMVLPILRDACQHLNSDGILVVEVGNSEQALIEMFPQIPFVWLEFEYGGEGVFLLEARQLAEHHADFVAACEQLPVASDKH